MRLIDADFVKKKHREVLYEKMIDKERGLDLSKYAENACDQFDLFIDNNAPTIDAVLMSVIEDIKNKIQNRSYGTANDSVIQGEMYERRAVLEIIDECIGDKK